MKKPMSNKSIDVLYTIEGIYPGTIEAIENKKCPLCKEPIGPFKNAISMREYEISGMCQTCQDKIFSE